MLHPEATRRAAVEEGMSLLRCVAVVGGSLAGLRTAEALRRLGYEGRLVLVGEEVHRPYDRPPLSQEVLRGERDAESIALTRPERFDALGLDLRHGRRAVALDPRARELALDDGERIRFDACALATGCRPRRLPGTPELAGIHLLRSLDDALAIRSALERGPRVAIVGAGFIGSEVAASCRQRGLEVALIDPLPTPLAAAVGTEIGEVVAGLHRDHGVELRLGTGVATFEGAGRLERVRLSDGSAVPADVAVVGIGVVPNTEWLASSGLALDDGVVCDETTATSVPGIVAVGDVARFFNPLFGVAMRIEHWTHAVEQAGAAAETLLAAPGAAKAFAPAPFVWSDQYELKIQSAGWMLPGDERRVVHGSLAERRCVVLHGREGRLVGAIALDRVRQLMGYRRMIREGASFDAAVAAASAA
jgi:3-phenylpropionate/trans-cinnamate dioxygenase ferredoxin reductase subunit